MDDTTRMVKFRKAMGYTSRYGLTKVERIDLAEMILRRDVESWATLTEPELVRLLDALEGYALISHLLRDQASGATGKSASGSIAAS